MGAWTTKVAVRKLQVRQVFKDTFKGPNRRHVFGFVLACFWDDGIVVTVKSSLKVCGRRQSFKSGMSLVMALHYE